MDVTRNTSASVSQVADEPTPATAQSALNVSHVVNKPTFDLSSFYISPNTPISFVNIDFNDRSYQNMWSGAWREKLATMQQVIKEKYEGKDYRFARVGDYLLAKHYPSAKGCDYRPAEFDLNGNNMVAHGTNAAVLLYSVINCNLQIVPVIKQLKLLGMEHQYIKDQSEGNYYQLCSGVRVTGLYYSSADFSDEKQMAMAAAKNGDGSFGSMQVVIFGDGYDRGDLLQDADNQETRKMVNIRGVAARNTQEKNIILESFREIYDTTRNEKIKTLYVCTFDILDETLYKRDINGRPDLRYILASSDTIDSLSHPSLNLTHIENNPTGLLENYLIDKDTPISFENINFEDQAMLFRIWDITARYELDKIRQDLKATYADGNFPCKTIGEYRASLPAPQPGDINFRPAAFDPDKNNVAHGTNLDVVTHAIINCGLQLVPGMEQLLRLGQQHEYTDKANPELSWLLSVAVRATTLSNLHSNFHDAESFAREAAKETTNLLSAIQVVVIGDGVNQRDMYANLNNESAFERINIWLLALKDDNDKRIVMDWLRLVRDTLGIEEINKLRFCTFEDIDDCRWEDSHPVRPKLAELMEKSHTIE
ncbi:hypothetical protein [Pantoea cypripedii]|uniref:Uncharacterized protein n=1 Tax=Pantoea cypripedii TaxID=55209 RepID=A0A6B9G2Q2_PANCY|nr:hypothetical protein [Pantoea cypripedii]QGY29010.1 hypothetical protein CUN67_08735 [Pantoea cypripedii]